MFLHCCLCLLVVNEASSSSDEETGEVKVSRDLLCVKERKSLGYFMVVLWEKKTPSGGNTGILAFADHLHAHI